MDSSIDSLRSDAVHFCKCGNHTRDYCNTLGYNNIYCIKKQHVKVFKKSKFFAKFTYLEYLNFKLFLIKGDFVGEFSVENELGGTDELDRSGNPIDGKHPFQVEWYLLRQIVKEQSIKNHQ